MPRMEKSGGTRGRPPIRSKMAIYCRIDRQAIAGVDEIAASMDPQPSRAQLIDLAVREFVERNKGKGKREATG